MSDDQGQKTFVTDKRVCCQTISSSQRKATWRCWLCPWRFIHVPSVTCDDFPLSILSHCCFRLTFVWTSKNPGLLRGLALQGASLTDSYQEAVVHVVEDVANPGQRVSWCARLGGHLIITPRLAQGSWIQCLDSIVTNLSYHGSKYGRFHWIDRVPLMIMCFRCISI